MSLVQAWGGSGTRDAPTVSGGDIATISPWTAGAGNHAVPSTDTPGAPAQCTAGSVGPCSPQRSRPLSERTTVLVRSGLQDMASLPSFGTTRRLDRPSFRHSPHPWPAESWVTCPLVAVLLRSPLRSPRPTTKPSLGGVL